MTASPIRGLLYSTPPDYDVFETPRTERASDETEASDEIETPPGTEESPGSVMARAYWTGTVPVDD